MADAPRVPFFCPAGAAFGVDLGACLQRVVDSGWYVLGPQVRDFEAAFARHVGVRHALGVANGTDALTLALRALGVQPGQPVVTVANAGCYASTALAQLGAQPLYVDVEPARLTMAPPALAAALAAHPVAAVIVTHLYGQMADMPRLAALCHAAKVPLIEDCAQAHGATLNGRLGDGGAVLTDDQALAERLRALRQYGWTRKYEVTVAGGANSRLDELQAAVLLAKLPHLDAANAARRAIAARYSAAFADLPLTCPPPPGPDHVMHLYVVRTPRRAALQAHLAAHGVASDIHYPLADHRQPVRAAPPPPLPVTDQACAEVLSLPCYPGLTQAQAARVIEAVRGFFAGA